MSDSPFVTIEEIADLLGVTPQRVYQLVRANEVPHVRVGGRRSPGAPSRRG
jgi:excisionase family DNA binding protein